MSSFGFFDEIFPVLFPLIFGILIVGFIVMAIKSVTQFKRNNDSPILTVDCKLVAKRTSIGHYHTGGVDATSGGMDHTTSSYYVTFEMDSGDRMEFSVGGREYGMLAEGDRGKLTFQGTRYKGFVRS